MRTLFPERLLGPNLDRLGFSTVRDRNLAFPFNRVRVEEQFVFLFDVIKHRHFLIAHYNQFLFLKRMEPRHENMSLDTARE